MDVKIVSSLPTISQASADTCAIVRTISGMKAMPLYHQFAMMLIPGASVYQYSRYDYSVSQWKIYAQKETWWGYPDAQIGDVIILTGLTSDTKARFVYYFRVERIEAEKRYGYCFLFLLEGQAPFWPGVSS